jgi:hypothetical protein
MTDDNSNPKPPINQRRFAPTYYGPPFDERPQHHYHSLVPDMTLRDWFAGQALIALIASENSGPPEMDAEIAYEFADAMMKERIVPE